MSTTLTRPGNRLRRTLAGALTTALAASSIALLPSVAQAEPGPAGEPTLTWKISQQFVDHLSTRSLGGGATFNVETGFTFSGGTGYFDSGNGASSIAYKGSVKGAFVNGTTEYYSVTVADPIVTVDAAGEGAISAVVSSASAAMGASPAASTDPKRVVVTTFDADESDWVASAGTNSLTDTPDWINVLPADSTTATNLSIAAGKPVDGKSFAPTFLGSIVSGVRAHFYDSGTGTSNPKKNPATFTAAVVAPTTKVTVNSTTPAGVALGIKGSGFSKVTKPGDAGVYVGVAESGGLPDVSSQAATAAFAAAVPVWSASIGTDGSFATALTVAADKLDPAKQYSVYTWRAHNHSTTSQDTETPLTIDFSSLVQKTSAPVVAVSSSTYGKTSTVTVNVPTVGSTPATGTVTLSGAVAQAATLANGTATFALPKTLSAGSKALTASYSGDVNYKASSAASTLVINKANVSVKRNKIKKAPTSKKAGKTTLTVKSTTGGPAVTGKVKVTFKKGKKTKTKTVTIKNGKGNVTIPKLAKGTWKITVKFNGTSNFNKTATKKAGSVKVKK